MTDGLVRGRRVVLVLAILIVAVGGLFALDLHARLTSGSTDFDDPAAANVAARAVIEDATGVDPQQGYVLIAHSDTPIDPAAAQPEVVRAAVALLQGRPEVREVLTYSATQPRLVSADRSKAAIFARTESVTERIMVPELERAIAADPQLAGRVELGGPTVVNDQVSRVVLEDVALTELIVLPALLALLIMVFRGLVAAMLPLAGGVFAVLMTVLMLRGVVVFTDLSVYSLNLVIALGLGMSVDFSLLIVSRYRAHLAEHSAGVPDIAGALDATMRTAGRTVLFSGLTIGSALLALLVFPNRQLYSMGIAGIGVTVSAVIYALIVLPALLTVLGPRVEALAPRRWQRGHRGSDENPDGLDPADRRWRRIAETVTRRPGWFALGATLFLLTLAVPLLRVEFTGTSGAMVLPASTSGGSVGRQLTTDFTPPLDDQEHLLVRAQPSAASAVTDYAARVAGVPGVAAISAPTQIDPEHWLLSVNLSGPSLSPTSRTAVRTIDDLDAPFPVVVTGPTADLMSLNTSLGHRLPFAALVAVLATLIMLGAMTRSIVLPVKAILLNALSLSAALGVIVLIFQDGVLAGLFGTTGQHALESTSPIILSAVAFGLSTDYGVFLLGRIKEEYDSGRPNTESVVAGIEHTGRIVTSAAALFCIAMGAMLLSRLTFIKELGFGTALAVVLDATVVRAVLLPSTMVLLGRLNWFPNGRPVIHGRHRVQPAGRHRRDRRRSTVDQRLTRRMLS